MIFTQPQSSYKDIRLIFESSNSLNNIQTFLDDGIADTPIDAAFVNPDNAVVGYAVGCLSWDGDEASEGEDYFSIDFDIQVNASTDGLLMTISAGEEINAKYFSNGVVIEKTITNTSEDNILINDGSLERPTSLVRKVLTLLQQFSDEINGMKNFFTEDGEYYFKVDMGGGDKFSIVDYYYNTVDYLVGTFKTSTSPNSGIFVRDIPKVREGESADICFKRNAGNNNLAATSINISFAEIDRPGDGDENDFTLSSILNLQMVIPKAVYSLPLKTSTLIGLLKLGLTFQSQHQGSLRNQQLQNL